MSRDSSLLRSLREEAVQLESSELLGSAMRSVTQASDLSSAIAAVLASRLASPLLEEGGLRRVCERALRGDPRPGADMVAILERDPAAISTLQVLMCLKGFHATQAHRVAASLWKTGSFEEKHIALAIQNRVSELWAVDVHPAAQIGGGLLMDHATGVVVGETAVIGNNCTILHGVTLGGTGKERGDRHPKIGDNVVLGAGSTVLGNIRVNDGATVGSQAVVTKEVPPGYTVIGLNKLLDPRKITKQRTDLKSRTETWQYEIDHHSGYDYYGAVSQVG